MRHNFWNLSHNHNIGYYFWMGFAGMEQRALYYPYIPHRHNNITSHNNIFCDKNHNEVYIMINFHILHTFYLCSTLFDHEMRKAVNVSLLYTSNSPLKNICIHTKLIITQKNNSKYIKLCEVHTIVCTLSKQAPSPENRSIQKKKYKIKVNLRYQRNFHPT